MFVRYINRIALVEFFARLETLYSAKPTVTVRSFFCVQFTAN